MDSYIHHSVPMDAYSMDSYMNYFGAYGCMRYMGSYMHYSGTYGCIYYMIPSMFFLLMDAHIMGTHKCNFLVPMDAYFIWGSCIHYYGPFGCICYLDAYMHDSGTCGCKCYLGITSTFRYLWMHLLLGLVYAFSGTGMHALL